MENERGEVRFTRKELFDEVWKNSVAGVSRKYGLNYARLIKACKDAGIPYPPSGYWTKYNLGKDVSAEIIPLTGDEEALVCLDCGLAEKRIKKNKVGPTVSKGKGEQPDNLAAVCVEKEKQPDDSEAISDKGKEQPDDSVTVSGKVEQPVDSATAAWTRQEEANEPVIMESTDANKKPADIQDTWDLGFLDDDEKPRVLEAAVTLEISENTRLHKALTHYKKKVEDYKDKQKTERNQGRYSRYNKPDDEPLFFNELSQEGVKRSYRILDALFRSVEKLGGSVNADLSMKIRKDIVHIKIAEGKDKIKHELTKMEARDLLIYQEKVKKGGYVSKPKIPQYDHVYNGKLRIVFGEKNYLRDTKEEKLEDRLGEILIKLYEKSEENRIERERREELHRQHEEEVRRKEELRKRIETEIKMTHELENEAEDYRIASDIRAYINAVIMQGKEDASSDWIAWARKKADWFDPTIGYEDEYLGKREHGKNKEEKDSYKNPMRRPWYWGI